jgi:hypothetical protein
MESGWCARKFGSYRINRTDEFRSLIGAISAPNGLREMPPDAKEFVYLFVPGLLTEHYGPSYMRTNLERCAELGLDAKRVHINTDASVATNAEVVRQAILKEAPRKVVLLGHSKGGVDIAGE